VATTLGGGDFENRIRTLSCLSVRHDAVVAWDLLHIWPIEEQICVEGHTIDACEFGHSFTEEVQLTRLASTT
jgi:hypothetical protein